MKKNKNTNKKQKNIIIKISFLLLIIVLVAIIIVFLNPKKKIFVFPELKDSIQTAYNEAKEKQELKKQEKENKKNEKSEQKSDIIDKELTSLDVWNAMSEKEKNKYGSLSEYERYLENPNSYVKNETNTINVAPGAYINNANGYYTRDMDMIFFPIETNYKLGGIYYNDDEELPIVDGDFTDFTITFTQPNKKSYTFHMYDYMTSIEKVKSVYGLTFENINETVERASTSDEYIYAVSTPNGAFAVVCNKSKGSSSYYNDLVCNRLQVAI